MLAGIKWLLVLFTISAGLYGSEKKVILCSFYPMYILTQNITKDVSGVAVECMTSVETGCLHDYQLTPQDMKKLNSAYVLVVNGGGMETFLNKAIAQFPRLKIVEASKGIQLIETEGHQRESDDDHHEHQFNPHVWVSVSGAILQVENICKGLMAVDSGNAQKYRLNADRFIKSLEELKSKMHQGLSGISDRNIITFHEAFPYFAREFNLNVAAVIEREAGSEPSARELAEIIKLIKEKKVEAIFIEPQYPAKTAQMISRETGKKLYTLDPIVTGPFHPDAYISIMEKNLMVLQEALR
ncbi:MAG: zinc ABC transporter substrate-binding protein [Fibrobacter sp.]|jgi:zinc transport system substrate-binding protein|nr:zinc ABC transporter substrate-binding protein [Fibrobacter sp.]